MSGPSIPHEVFQRLYDDTDVARIFPIVIEFDTIADELHIDLLKITREFEERPRTKKEYRELHDKFEAFEKKWKQLDQIYKGMTPGKLCMYWAKYAGRSGENPLQDGWELLKRPEIDPYEERVKAGALEEGTRRKKTVDHWKEQVEILRTTLAAIERPRSPLLRRLSSPFSIR
jgi:hypothetical protein